jgi:hypothetical protein
MPTRLAKYFNQQIGCAIDDRRRMAEARYGVHVAVYAEHLDYLL